MTDLGVAVGAAPPLRPRVLRAALVLFASEPRAHVRGAAVQLVRREGIGPGPGPSSAREECAGPLADTVDCCLRFVAAHTRRFEIVAGSRREALPEYPEPVLREAIVNALAHRDYGLAGTTVDIAVWDDRIEVRSPGPLPGHITLENMRVEHYSRNPRIMRVMKILGLVEEYGEGIDRMYREMEARLMEPPVFEATASSVTVVLRNRMLVDVEDQSWLNQLDRGDVTAAERRTLVAARRAGAVAPRDLRALLPDADVDALLSRMVARACCRASASAAGPATSCRMLWCGSPAARGWRRTTGAVRFCSTRSAAAGASPRTRPRPCSTRPRRSPAGC